MKLHVANLGSLIVFRYLDIRLIRPHTRAHLIVFFHFHFYLMSSKKGIVPLVLQLPLQDEFPKSIEFALKTFSTEKSHHIIAQHLNQIGRRYSQYSNSLIIYFILLFLTLLAQCLHTISVATPSIQRCVILLICPSNSKLQKLLTLYKHFYPVSYKCYPLLLHCFFMFSALCVSFQQIPRRSFCKENLVCGIYYVTAMSYLVLCYFELNQPKIYYLNFLF